VTLPDGTVRRAIPARLTDHAPELLRIADKVRILDAQARRQGTGFPRAFLVRARNVVAFVYGEENEIPEIPGPVR